MNRVQKICALAALAVLGGALAIGVQAEPGKLTVRLDQPGVKISPMLYGLMTEEINHAYDGGLYGELIRNRIFKDDPNQPVHWSVVTNQGSSGTAALDPGQPVNTAALTTSLRLDITRTGKGQRVGIANEGYWGIPVKPNTRYRASFYARAAAGFTGPLNVDMESNDGATIYARARVPRLTTDWRQYTVTLKTGKAPPSEANRFVISSEKPGQVWFNLVSLFPPTWKDRPNGNRIDLMQKLSAMRPAFLRLPGGNYLEGNTIAERFDWKKTIHDVSQRPGHPGPWGYRSTDGLGLLEFLEWCEDLHMEPVLAVFAGYALRGEHIPPGPELQPFVQDALDEIEYATGDTHSQWGAQRALDGHPASFKIQYVEIGNEDWFDRSGSYDGRFAQFYDAIRARYPVLKLIATTRVSSRVPDVLDDHYYRSAADMERDVHHYDNHSRTGPKIFVGEWASTEGSPTPTMNAALGDAAWLTGLERNSDLVLISSYAPLLVNVNRGARQWGTNLIGYDALNSFGSPSYYAQAMFGSNRGDQVLPVEVMPQSATQAEAPAPHGGIGLGTWLTQAEYRDIKVTQGDRALYQDDFANGTTGWRLGQGEWKVQDGALRQSGEGENYRATVGDRNWTDYTYSLKARKISGREGFLILFHNQDNNNFLWWNIGGWNNTQDAIEKTSNGAKSMLGGAVPDSVETGRWYDIRIEVKGQNIRCFLDGKLIEEVTDTASSGPGPLFATASRDLATGDVILKVVNVDPGDQQLRIDLQGVQNVGKTATAEVLAGQPGDINTLAEPEKVAPHTITIQNVAPQFMYTFPAHSVTVLRVKAK